MSHSNNQIKNLYNSFTEISEYKLLTKGQKEFVKLFFEGKNLFLTGAAGTGKSFVIKMLLDFLEKNGIFIGRTASTGVAALNIGGSTLHSFFGIGLALEDAPTLIQKLYKNKKVQSRLKSSHCLVIDEISMVKADLLDKLDLILKYYRHSNKPFGGLQVLLTGDIFQLPPVWKDDEERLFFFESRAWQEGNFSVIDLHEIVRQESDPEFAKLLNRVRFGEKGKYLDLLDSRKDFKFVEDEIEATRLFCKNVDVDNYNNERLSRINAPLFVYNSTDDALDDRFLDQLDKYCLAPKNLKLKVGAIVMCLYNMPDLGLVNGSMGVVKFLDKNEVRVKFKHKAISIPKCKWEIKEADPMLDGKVKYKTKASREQYPLKVAWASSCHKAQGSTIDRAVIDLSEAFAEGQAYVALSRVRNLESLSLIDFPHNKIKVNKKCLEFHEKIKDGLIYDGKDNQSNSFETKKDVDSQPESHTLGEIL